MEPITWEHNPSPAKLDVMGVEDWPIWEKEVSTFRWTYDQKETCYFLEGEVVVTPEGGEPVKLGKKDDKTYATFSCDFTDKTDVQINPNAKDSEEELKAKEAKLLGRESAQKLNKRHEGWIYEIASWQIP